MSKGAAIFAITSLLATCMYNSEPSTRTRSQYGVRCMGSAPESYLASEVGKPGFPILKTEELRELRKIERVNNSKVLRIAWVKGSAQREFIIFEAYDGPCESQAPGYHVLNGACNEYYQPGENPYYTHPVMGCYPSPTP